MTREEEYTYGILGFLIFFLLFSLNDYGVKAGRGYMQAGGFRVYTRQAIEDGMIDS